jgi:hypothetical protein
MKPVGRKPSKTLFKDFDDEGIYTLEEFHDIFVECEDITEYEAAIKLVGSWTEWERIKRDWPNFQSYITVWKEEINIRLKSQTIRKLREIASGDTSQAAAAAKWIAEEGWQRKSGKGRPTKAETAREAKALAKATSDTNNEYTRMLELLDGGKLN